MKVLISQEKLLPSVLLVVVFIAFTCIAAFASDAAEPKVYGVAIKGYDPVAYFTENRAVKGSSAFIFNWNEARWQFSKAEHRDLFAANPKKYAPNHGGF